MWRLGVRGLQQPVPVSVQVLLEAGLERLEGKVIARHNADSIRGVVAATVGVPNRVLVGASILPRNLVPACRLLRADRRPGATLTNKVRAAKFERRARAAAVVKEKMIPNLGQVGRSIRLDHCRGRPDLPVVVQVLVEAG